MRTSRNLKWVHLGQSQRIPSAVQLTSQINPRADLISLTDLVEGRGRMRTVMVSIVMSITSAESAERSTVKQKRSNISNSQDSYQRQMIFMCLKIVEKWNMFMIFQGYGHSKHLLNGMDPSHKFNEELRECVFSLLSDSHVACPVFRFCTSSKSWSCGCLHKFVICRQIPWEFSNAHRKFESPHHRVEWQF